MYFKRTARAKWEEGVGDGRSVWSETTWATRGIQWMEQWAATSREGANPRNPSVVWIEG